MLLTITTTRTPATDLGYLLHKHPDRPQSVTVPAGTAHVFYPEAEPARCTAALLLEVDPVGLVRGRGRDRPAGATPEPGGFSLGQYVNDRPYAASSLLAMALKAAFRTALAGRCEARPALAASPIPLRIRVPALPCRGGGAGLARRVFEPLGWSVAAPAVLDVVLTGEMRLADARGWPARQAGRPPGHLRLPAARAEQQAAVAELMP